MKYDLELFDQFNDEYRGHPIHPSPSVAAPQESLGRDVNASQLAARTRESQMAEKRLKAILQDVDLTNKVVLELGCGQGRLTSLLPERAQVMRAIGVDARPSLAWNEDSHPAVSFVAADLSTEDVIPPRSIDTIISQGVLERSSRPLQLLAALHRVLSDRGEA
jgi:trans-aconitate methyltransferase